MLEKLLHKALRNKDGFYFKIKVIANAKKNHFEWADGEAYHLKIKIAAPAVDGKANKAILAYLAELLQLPKNNIEITKGEKSSVKTIFILGGRKG